MRTTLSLPDEVLKRAKIAAVERGTTLRELVRQALARDLGLVVGPPKRKRAKFPIVGSVSPGALDVTTEDITRLEAGE